MASLVGHQCVRFQRLGYSLTQILPAKDYPPRVRPPNQQTNPFRLGDPITIARSNPFVKHKVHTKIMLSLISTLDIAHQPNI